MNYINILLIILFTLFGSFISSRIENKPKLKFILPTVAALLAFALTITVDEISRNYEKPTIYIKTDKSENNLRLFIKSDKSSVESVSLEYHLLGHITNLMNHNSTTDVLTQAWAIGDPQMPYLTNKFELLLERIVPNKNLQYDISFNNLNTKSKINFLNDDKYKITYVWNYKGEKYFETEWHQTIDDKLTDNPNGIIGVIRYNKNPKATFSPIIKKREL